MMRRYLSFVLLLLSFSLAAGESETAKEKKPRAVPGAAQDREEPRYDGGMLYLKLGGALVFDERRVLPQPAFGIGYRYTQAAFAVDISFFNETIGPTVDHRNYKEKPPYEREKLRITISRWANLSFLWFVQPVSWHSFYLGGGLAIETLDLELNDDISSQTGLSVTATAGWEFLRDRAVTLFVQIEADIPCYRGHFAGDDFWVPSLLLFLGAGF